MEILHPVLILNFLSSSSCNSARTKQILSELDNHRELWCYVDFSRWRPYRRKYSFAFWFLWHLTFRKAKNYLRIKFRPDISIHGQVITTSGYWRQMSTIFKFYSWFRRTLHRHQHFVILHWPTKFYANRMIADRVMTSYWLHKMAAIASQICFRLLIWPRWNLGRSRAIGIPNFDQICQSTACVKDGSLHILHNASKRRMRVSLWSVNWQTSHYLITYIIG